MGPRKDRSQCDDCDETVELSDVDMHPRLFDPSEPRCAACAEALSLGVLKCGGTAADGQKCSQDFYSRNALNHHIRTVHPERKHVCPLTHGGDTHARGAHHNGAFTHRSGCALCVAGHVKKLGEEAAALAAVYAALLRDPEAAAHPDVCQEIAARMDALKRMHELCGGGLLPRSVAAKKTAKAQRRSKRAPPKRPRDSDDSDSDAEFSVRQRRKRSNVKRVGRSRPQRQRSPEGQSRCSSPGAGSHTSSRSVAHSPPTHLRSPTGHMSFVRTRAQSRAMSKSAKATLVSVKTEIDDAMAQTRGACSGGDDPLNAPSPGPAYLAEAHVVPTADPTAVDATGMEPSFDGWQFSHPSHTRVSGALHGLVPDLALNGLFTLDAWLHGIDSSLDPAVLGLPDAVGASQFALAQAQEPAAGAAC